MASYPLGTHITSEIYGVTYKYYAGGQ